MKTTSLALCTEYFRDFSFMGDQHVVRTRQTTAQRAGAAVFSGQCGCSAATGMCRDNQENDNLSKRMSKTEEFEDIGRVELELTVSVKGQEYQHATHQQNRIISGAALHMSGTV